MVGHAEIGPRKIETYDRLSIASRVQNSDKAMYQQPTPLWAEKTSAFRHFNAHSAPLGLAKLPNNSNVFTLRKISGLYDGFHSLNCCAKVRFGEARVCGTDAAEDNRERAKSV
jgi:hypothetical protein